MIVTYSEKRYIAICAGCDSIFEANRKDAFTCCPACRVKAHRNGMAKSLRAIAESLRIHVADIQQAGAILRLVDAGYLDASITAGIDAGDVTLDEVAPLAANAFVRAVFDIVERGAA